MEKALIDTVTKTRTDTANKIADKIISTGKWKQKEKTKKVEEIYIPPEKRIVCQDRIYVITLMHIFL